MVQRLVGTGHSILHFLVVGEHLLWGLGLLYSGSTTKGLPPPCLEQRRCHRYHLDQASAARACNALGPSRYQSLFPTHSCYYHFKKKSCKYLAIINQLLACFYNNDDSWVFSIAGPLQIPLYKNAFVGVQQTSYRTGPFSTDFTLGWLSKRKPDRACEQLPNAMEPRTSGGAPASRAGTGHRGCPGCGTSAVGNVPPSASAGSCILHQPRQSSRACFCSQGKRHLFSFT